jgi:peptidyl-prolyl cis-trans isomerase B (cyclophilin B)
MHAQAIAPALVLFSVLFPSKLWYAPDQAWTVVVRPDVPTTLVLTDFVGKAIDPRASSDVSAEKSIDVKDLWPPIAYPGTYLLYAVPRGKLVNDFVGTPLVIQVRPDTRRDAPPGAMVTKIQPLCYAILGTDHGDMTIGFYYDVAPHTVDNFLALAGGGFYDGLVFHRVVPQFLIQGGDPRGDGTGGPGYQIDAEFSDREHGQGILSMSRQLDPFERHGEAPRPEFANTAGSQFFICLDDTRAMQLDRRYTVFGKVIGEEGLKILHEIGSAETDPQTERPRSPQVIRSIKIMPVVPGKNPYPALLTVGEQRSATTQPAR